MRCHSSKALVCTDMRPCKLLRLRCTARQIEQPESLRALGTGPVGLGALGLVRLRCHGRHQLAVQPCALAVMILRVTSILGLGSIREHEWL